MKQHFPIKKPIMTERASRLKEMGQYIFMVENDATKNEVAKAIEQMYKVGVIGVNTVRIHPKPKNYRGRTDLRGGYKKAIVTLKKGDVIDLE